MNVFIDCCYDIAVTRTLNVYALMQKDVTISITHCDSHLLQHKTPLRFSIFGVPFLVTLDSSVVLHTCSVGMMDLHVMCGMYLLW